jgi:hypothetical protein
MEGPQPGPWCAASLDEIQPPQGFSLITLAWLWCDQPFPETQFTAEVQNFDSIEWSQLAFLDLAIQPQSAQHGKITGYWCKTRCLPNKTIKVENC